MRKCGKIGCFATSASIYSSFIEWHQYILSRNYCSVHLNQVEADSDRHEKPAGLASAQISLIAVQHQRLFCTLSTPAMVLIIKWLHAFECLNCSRCPHYSSKLVTVSSENGTTQKCVCVYLPADAWSSHVWSVLCVIRNISYNWVVHVMAPTQMWTETQRYIIYVVGCSQESSAAGKQPARADTAGKGPVGLSFYVKCCQPKYQDALQRPGAFCRMQASMLFWPINICIAEYMSQRLSFWERTERSQLGRVPNYICCFVFFTSDLILQIMRDVYKQKGQSSRPNVGPKNSISQLYAQCT